MVARGVAVPEMAADARAEFKADEAPDPCADLATGLAVGVTMTEPFIAATAEEEDEA